MYDELSTSRLRWERMEVFLVDERMLPVDHSESNAGLVIEHLVSKVTTSFHAVDTSLSPPQAAEEYAKAIGPFLPLDLVVVGLGADGHIASLFPGSSSSAGEPPVVPTWSKRTGTWRISMSYGAIEASSTLLMLVTGESKRDALTRMLRGDDVPAAKLDPKGELVIICDRAAHPD